VREVYTRREAIVASLLGLAIAAIVWGPVLLRPFGYTPAVDLRTLRLPETSPAPARLPTPSARIAKGTPTGSVDINQADVTALQTLPGIGPTLANRIVMHRKAYGPFQEVDALMEVDGIGPKRFDKLKSWIEVH
jgi:competence protein ComEA